MVTKEHIYQRGRNAVKYKELTLCDVDKCGSNDFSCFIFLVCLSFNTSIN